MANPDSSHFLFGFPLSAAAWQRYSVRELLPAQIPGNPGELNLEIRHLADRVRETLREGPSAEALLALRTVDQVLRVVARHHLSQAVSRPLVTSSPDAENLLHSFGQLYPGRNVALGDATVADLVTNSADNLWLEMLIVATTNVNPAAAVAKMLFDDAELRSQANYLPLLQGISISAGPAAENERSSLWDLLQAPHLASPDSLAGQLEFMRAEWAHLLPPEMLAQLTLALDVLLESDTFRSPEYGPPPVLEFGANDDDEAEPEAFSTDAPWMSNVVLMAKSVYVWLDQLARTHEQEITRLDQIPDQELDRLAEWGVTGLWLIGLWQRSEASRKIKQQMGNEEAAASAYALDDYRIADDLGGEDAWQNLSERAGQRGIRLASDMVPNHMGIDSRWVREHPDYFVQLEQAPYPAYRYDGPDLCDDPAVSVRIEDGYRDHSDAAVVFQRVDQGTVRYIYHGNDGTSMPWNDTAQLNFLLPEVRAAVIEVILDVARRFPIIRFDAAMTLAKKHFQRLWYPKPGDAGAIPSRAEHGMNKPEFDAVFPLEFWREVVDRVAQEVPNTLLLAEAFWLMEGYFVRTLGMHRVYNSAFMNMLKMEENAEYRQTIKNVLEFSPAILQRFVNFMNNPDERTAVQQFGKEDKYFGCALLLVTLPGLPMLGHGQIEGFSEKYGMEYRKAYWDEKVDGDLVARHEREIFPLMRDRHLFSGADHFALFDFETEFDGVDENVFAYANQSGDQYSLVLYNNNDSTTNGNVRRSTAINTGSGDNPHLVHRSLGEALGIDASPGVWYVYRDPIRQMEYLQRGAVLAHEGFATELGGYQYRVLLEFQRVTESDGPWSDISNALRGEGTPSLARVKRRLEMAPDLAELRAWVQPEFLQALQEVRIDELEVAELPSNIVTALRATAAIANNFDTKLLGPQSRLDLAALYRDIETGDLLPALYVQKVLDQIAPLADTGDDLPIFTDELSAIVHHWTQDWDRAHQIVAVAEVVWRSQRHFVAMSTGKIGWFAEMLSNAATQQALGVNAHEGKTYLKKDNLEEILRTLVVGADSTGAPTGFLDARALILGAAETAGYEVEKFANRLKHKQ
ncbi:MAG: glycosidase [Candidatus Krumholzibacteriia bacterium]|jgi:glycosidase